MKRILIPLFVLISFVANAVEDSVVMRISGKPVSMEEFLFLAKKNEIAVGDNKASIRDFVELFKIFKLKVAEAVDLGYEELPSFKKEYDKYCADLRLDFSSDRKSEESVAKEFYKNSENAYSFELLLLPLPKKSVATDTLRVYQLAQKVYRRIASGEEMPAVVKDFNTKGIKDVKYNDVRSFIPGRGVKAFELNLIKMHPGELSRPFRTTFGYNIIRLKKKEVNPGQIRVAHLLIAPTSSTKSARKEALKKAKDIYMRAKSGESFDDLVDKYSADSTTLSKHGELPPFVLGQMLEPFEKAAFSLKEKGEISEPIETKYGYHIIRLIEKIERPSFETQANEVISAMRRSEWNFELLSSHDHFLKEEYKYRFYPEAYSKLESLSSLYFVTSSDFYDKGVLLTQPLFELNGKVYKQCDFVSYIRRSPFSTQSYSGDFMSDVYKLYVREIAQMQEKKDFNKLYPSYQLQVQEYHDGLLLFEVSNRRIWSQPIEQQKELEKEWVKELEKKYPVEVNWTLINNLIKNN